MGIRRVISALCQIVKKTTDKQQRIAEISQLTHPLKGEIIMRGATVQLGSIVRRERIANVYSAILDLAQQGLSDQIPYRIEEGAKVCFVDIMSGLNIPTIKFSELVKVFGEEWRFMLRFYEMGRDDYGRRRKIPDEAIGIIKLMQRMGKLSFLGCPLVGGMTIVFPREVVSTSYSFLIVKSGDERFKVADWLTLGPLPQLN